MEEDCWSSAWGFCGCYVLVPRRCAQLLDPHSFSILNCCIICSGKSNPVGYEEVWAPQSGFPAGSLVRTVQKFLYSHVYIVRLASKFDLGFPFGFPAKITPKTYPRDDPTISDVERTNSGQFTKPQVAVQLADSE